MKLTWHGHSCFTISTVQGTVTVDPFQDNYVPGCGSIRPIADAVYCSHLHGDHCGKEAVQLTGNPCSVDVETIASWHDEVQGAKRGANTIHMFSAERMNVVHLGDLGCLLDDVQVSKLAQPDVLLIPIGGTYTLDPQQAKTVADQLQPRIVIPMHYKGNGFGFDVLATVDEFLALWEGSVKVLGGNVIEITTDTPAQVIVPAFPRQH